jgi:subtilase family serine protease
VSPRPCRDLLGVFMGAMVVVTVAGCGVLTSEPPRQQATHIRVFGGARSHPPLGVAIARGRDLGPLRATAVVHLTLGLSGRDAPGLGTALAAGEHFSPADYATRFGPDPEQVARLRSDLAAAGISSSWMPGDTSMAAYGSVRSVDNLFGVRIDRRIGPDGVHFYAPASAARLPASFAGVVNGISGLDDYPSMQIAAAGASAGVSPQEMLDYYDASSLRGAPLDGGGATIVFIEIDRFDPHMLAAYAQKFSLPVFDVSVHSNRSAWGSPSSDQGEADLDLEIAHGIAPGAKEVVYYSAADEASVAAAEAAAYRAYPAGAIASISLGTCEVAGERDNAMVLNDVTTRAAAENWSIFVSSGDRGAYGCVPDGDLNTLSVNVGAALPTVTAVGGTYALFNRSGGYVKEAAWGEPLEQWGSGGGASMFWPLPSWQVAPGVRNQFSTGRRETPDISANADPESGWDVFAKGTEVAAGGTSAAAPFWAAITALIDQDLSMKSLRPVGFANPALYKFAQAPSGLPSHPFHDVSLGTNLYYPATPAWDFATGLGTPDVAALAADFEWLRGSQG